MSSMSNISDFSKKWVKLNVVYPCGVLRFYETIIKVRKFTEIKGKETLLAEIIDLIRKSLNWDQPFGKDEK